MVDGSSWHLPLTMTSADQKMIWSDITKANDQVRLVEGQFDEDRRSMEGWLVLSTPKGKLWCCSSSLQEHESQNHISWYFYSTYQMDVVTFPPERRSSEARLMAGLELLTIPLKEWDSYDLWPPTWWGGAKGKFSQGSILTSNEHFFVQNIHLHIPATAITQYDNKFKEKKRSCCFYKDFLKTQ